MKKKLAIPYPPPKSPVLLLRNDMIHKDRMLGASLGVLARKYALSKTHVRRIVQGVPVVVRPPPKPRKATPKPDGAANFWKHYAETMALRKRGFSYRQIAERVGISRTTAHGYACCVKIVSLEGGAWLGRAGRPKAWKLALMNNAQS